MDDIKSPMKEIAVLMKMQMNEENCLEFIPLEVLEGTYVEEAGIYIGKDGKTYVHISDVILYQELISYVNTIFYCSRRDILTLQETFPDYSFNQLKEKLFQDTLKYSYKIGFCLFTERLEIIKEDVETKTITLFLDEETQVANEIQEKLDSFSEEMEISEIEPAENTAIYMNETKNYSFQPKALSDYIKSHVFGQEKAIDKIVQSIWSNYYWMDEDNANYNKENILVVGPTGVGKTEIFRRIEEFNRNIVVHIADLSSVTESGYMGESLTDIMQGVLLKCIEVKNGIQIVNKTKAEHSIVVLDEFDKIAIRGGYGIDVGNRPVQEEVLKMIEGKEMLIPLKLNGMVQNVVLNTQKITFACCGAFDGITKSYEKQLGFGNDISKNNLSKTYCEIAKEDFIKYGFIRELIGRLPVMVHLNDLSLELFVKIVKDSKKSLFIKKLKMLKSLVETVEIEEDLYVEIAKIAFAKHVGARGLDEASVDLFFPILNEVSNLNEIYQYAKMDGTTVKDPNRYVLERKKGS